MHTPPRSRGHSTLRAFRHIARSGVPFIAMGAQTFDYHTSETAPRIDPFASQNFPRSPQPQAQQGLTNARETHSLSDFASQLPQPLPAAQSRTLRTPSAVR